MDSKDKQILHQLDIDARQSLNTIAKKVRLSKEVVNYRIKRLEREGIIKGYHAIINMSKLGYMCNRFFVKLKNTTLQQEQKIISYFVQHPSYWWVDSCDGFRDLGVGSWEKNIHDIHKRKDELFAFKEHLDDVEQSIYLSFFIYKRGYLHKPTQQTIQYITEERYTPDEMDFKILRTISAHARMRTIDIAKQLNTTTTIVSYRLSKLRKQGIIAGYRALIDLAKMGFYWYKIEFVLKNYAKKHVLLSYCAQHPNIIYAYESTGKADLECELEVESYEAFRKILIEMRELFCDSIESYKHLLWTKEHKLLFFPS